MNTRLVGLMRKELLQIVRDPSAIAIAFVLPVVLLLIFGYGVSLDAKHVPVGVVVDAPTPQTQAFVAGMRESPYFDVREYGGIAAAREAMQERRINGIVWLRGDFSRRALTAGDAPVGVAVNGVDANDARILEGYVQGVWVQWLAREARLRGGRLALPVELQSRIWYNPALRSRDYLVPGLIAVVMTLIGALLTALVVAREWERGTYEALMATPVSMREILLGKVLPYFVLGMGGMALSVAMALWLFHVPLRGSALVLFGSAALFLLAALGMGLLISTAAKSQFVAGLIAIIVTFLPAFILSGFIFDIRSMPEPIQVITHVIAARYFVAILQTVFLAGNVWSVILPNGAALLVMALFFLGIVARLSRKRLD